MYVCLPEPVTLHNEASVCYYTHLPHRQLLLAQTFSTAISFVAIHTFQQESTITSSRTLYWRAHPGLLMIWSTDHRLFLLIFIVVAYYPDYCTLSHYYVYQQTQGYYCVESYSSSLPLLALAPSLLHGFRCYIACMHGDIICKVEPLFRGHHWDPTGCPVYSGTFL